MSDVTVYSVGLCKASACAPVSMDAAAVAHAANLAQPTGVTPWHVSEESHFANGPEFPNPCPCEQTPGRQHWLLVC